MSLGYRPDFCKYFGEIAPLIIKAPGWSRVSQILGITIGNYGGKEGKFGTRVGKRVQNNTRSANKPTQKKTRGSLGATRNCVRTRARSASNSIETRKKCFLFPSLNSLLKTIKKINILILIYIHSNIHSNINSILIYVRV
jgi:hypothetical protein